MKSPRIGFLFFLICSLAILGCQTGAPLHISFSQSAAEVDAYDFVEVTARVYPPRAGNPFVDASLTGWFETADGSHRWPVEGFCDSDDGGLFRIRFMPQSPGEYRYAIEYRQSGATTNSSGAFRARNGHRRGQLRVDGKNPWHFVWEGTGEHYFFNGTTAYWLVGWTDEKVIESSLERLRRLKVNRIRVTLAGRADKAYGEPVMVGPNWTYHTAAWPAKQAEDIFHPGFDYRRFNLPHWQKFERMLGMARERDIVISVVLDMNDSQVHPVAGSDDENRWIRYAVARLAVFSNVTWDLGDDLDLYRDDAWTRRTGVFVKSIDPYQHLATSHPVDNRHQDRTSDWFDFTSFQEWSRQQHSFMLAQRKRQQALGRIIPLANEEYGYEDHYPPWSSGPGTESADVLRRTAWEIAMAGGYGTTGESARRGTNVWPDTGGGWINGRGDESMTMLEGYSHMVDFFTKFSWWETEPHDELVNGGNYCLARTGKLYAVYLPHGGTVSLRLAPGTYAVEQFNPLTGQRAKLKPAEGPLWTSPEAPTVQDWAFLLQTE